LACNIVDEYSFDRYYEKFDRIYQVTVQKRWTSPPPQFVPSFIDVPELKKDVKAVDMLLQIYGSLEQLFTRLLL
jgi:hypothetical protein